MISGVLLQRPKQVKVDCRVDGTEFPNEITAATLVSGLLYVGLHCAKYHTTDTLFVWVTEATLRRFLILNLCQGRQDPSFWQGLC